MKNRAILILIISIICVFLFKGKASAIDLQTGGIELGLDGRAQVQAPDTLTIPEFIQHNWFELLKNHRLDLKDVNVRYPKFLQFCVNVYRWFDTTFNTYDPDWVTGTGKSGKVRIFSDNWSDIYDFRFADRPLVMTSNLYYNIGIQANYSILSASYSVDLNTLISKKKSHHKKMSFNITTARLFAEAYYWQNTGGHLIRRLSEIRLDRHDDVAFDGLNFRAAGVMGFWVFDSKRFSFAAPYELSTRQVKSAGSFLAGASGTFYKAKFDFSSLPDHVDQVLQFPFKSYRLNYNAVNLLGGYSYNWVCNKHFLLNSTTLPGIGVSFSFSDSTTGRRDVFSASLRQMLSLTYTNKDFFATANGTFHGNMLPTGDLAFLVGIINFQVSTGIRF